MSLAGLLMVVSSWLHYLWLIPREWVPERPIGHQLILIGGAVLAAIGAAMGWGIDPVAGLLSTLAFFACAGGAGFFVYLMTWAPLPDTPIAVAVGEPIPDFSARDAAGEVRRIAQWRGRRLLLKFFRGHW